MRGAQARHSIHVISIFTSTHEYRIAQKRVSSTCGHEQKRAAASAGPGEPEYAFRYRFYPNAEALHLRASPSIERAVP